MLRKVVALVAVLAAALVGSGAARAQGLDETCALALAKFDPDTVNVAFPDEGAEYFIGAYAALPGTEIVIHGAYAHARYFSFNAYDLALRPIAGISDAEIVPDAGSANPFVAGADRDAEARRYTVRIVFRAAPARRAPNTLYVNPTVSPAGTFIYRIYLPDRDRDEYGDVGLPSATVVPAGRDETAASSCAQLHKPTVAGVNQLLARLSTPTDPAPSSPDPPVWRKFVNFVSAVAVNVLGTPSPGGLPLDRLGGSGGFLSNRDNAYVAAGIERGRGRVVVTRFEPPTFPDTRPGTRVMPGGQVRYWSLCENDPLTQRFVACANDDRVPLDANGYATFVVSPPGERPANAISRCGVTWLPWGLNARGVLILRHMLPAPGFMQSVQAAKVDHEAATMGPYLPVSRYYRSAKAFEAQGCPPR